MGVNQRRRNVRKFKSLCAYINKHYMEDISFEKMADTAGLSKYHFSRLFKQYTNSTFSDYLCGQRVKVAEELLACSALSIAEIARLTGFPSLSTFNRRFKQQNNCTPSEYRIKNL